MSRVARNRPSALMPRGTTLIAVLMDRSGSMASIREEMQAAFAQFIVRQQEAPGACAVSLYQFDDAFETVYEGLPLHAVPPLALEPRGGTALYDAMAKAITTVRRDLDPDRVIMVIITDAEDTASKEHKGAEGARKIAAMIRRRQVTDGWTFVFLGAGLEDIAAILGARTLPFESPREAVSSAGTLALRARVAD